MYRPQPAPVFRCLRGEAAAAVLLALGLHLAAFAMMQDATREEAVTPSQPIQVAWIGVSQPKAENTPAAPPKPQSAPTKPKAKPKAVKQAKAKQNAVLSTTPPAT